MEFSDLFKSNGNCMEYLRSNGKEVADIENGVIKIAGPPNRSRTCNICSDTEKVWMRVHVSIGLSSVCVKLSSSLRDLDHYQESFCSLSVSPLLHYREYGIFVHAQG